MPSEEPVYLYEGVQYRMGYEGKGQDARCCVWSRETGSARTFPLTEEGWRAAWTLFARLDAAPGRDRNGGAESSSPPSPLPPDALLRLEEALRRNAGRMACPESELTYPRDRIHEALVAELQKADEPGGVSPERREFLETALIELETFVPDQDAALVEAYGRWEEVPSSVAMSAEVRDEAERILKKIEDRQAKVLAWMGGDPTPYVDTQVLHHKSLVVGAARKVPNSLGKYRETQTFGLLTVVILWPLGSFIALMTTYGASPTAHGWLWVALVVGWFLSPYLAMVGLSVKRLFSRITSEGSRAREVTYGFAIVLALGLPITMPILMGLILTRLLR